MPPWKHQAEHQYRLPPADRRSKQKNKPNARTIPTRLLRYTAKQLALLATSGTVHKELLAIGNDQKDTIRPPHRLHATNSPTNKKNRHTGARRTCHIDQRSKRSSPRGTT